MLKFLSLWCFAVFPLVPVLAQYEPYEASSGDGGFVPVSYAVPNSTEAFSERARYRGGVAGEPAIVSDNRGGPNIGLEFAVEIIAPSEVLVGDPVVLVAKVKGTDGKARIRWSSGDGAEARTSIFRHSFAQEGAYELSVVVENSAGAQISEQTVITVLRSHEPPAVVLAQEVLERGQLIVDGIIDRVLG